MNTDDNTPAELRALIAELRALTLELQATRETIRALAEELRGARSSGGLLQKLAGKLGV